MEIVLIILCLVIAIIFTGISCWTFNIDKTRVEADQFFSQFFSYIIYGILVLILYESSQHFINTGWSVNAIKASQSGEYKKDSAESRDYK